ncbi:unnamed protein product [Dovyalis caffra]|uniref:Uncharacterized protein n=1 Tax=Dovyalis caffra TaxID=77055 RepID=A0AAV1QMI6_9ROSI|nr:unnamed protein product [Dovyalis caffra]
MNFSLSKKNANDILTRILPPTVSNTVICWKFRLMNAEMLNSYRSIYCRAYGRGLMMLLILLELPDLCCFRFITKLIFLNADPTALRPCEPNFLFDGACARPSESDGLQAFGDSARGELVSRDGDGDVGAMGDGGVERWGFGLTTIE